VSRKLFQLRSIKVRVTLFTLAIFIASIWTISFYVGRMLQLDMERVLGEQQFTTVSMVAADINEDIQSRLDALKIIADTVASSLPGGAVATQKALENFPVFQHLFNAGTVVVGFDGTAIASVPAAFDRGGVNLMDRDQVVAALKEGRSSVGKPVLGKVLKEPIVSMAAPIRDPQGKVIGALIGNIDLGQPTFLDKVSNATSGKTGTVSLVSVPHRLTVTSSDKKLVLFALPAPGVNPYLDRNMAGFEGSTIVVNVLGQEQLASVKTIPAAQWYLFSGLPIEEVFAPVRAMQKRVLLAVILLTLLAGSLTWWMLKRELAPMFDTAKKLAQMAEITETPQPLPITRQHEIGELIGGFNRLLETLGRRETALQKSEQSLAITLNSIGDAVIATDPSGRVNRMNPTAERLTGWALAEAMGQPLTEVFHIVNAATQEPVADPVQLVMAHGQVVALANHTLLLAKDRQKYQIADSAAPIRNAEGDIVGVVLVFSDVTEKYQAEVALHQSQESLKEAQRIAGIGSYALDFSAGLWYSSEELDRLFGIAASFERSVQGWETLIHPADRAMMGDYFKRQIVGQHKTFDKEYRIVRHNDQAERWVHGLGRLEFDAQGGLQMMIGTIQDITERKHAQNQIQALAFSDPLTGLANRRLLMERLEQSMVGALRHGHQNALLFVDMDDFKTLNDSLGHDKGDQLLQQVAGRVRTCVREGDTVARLGGDEFVVLVEYLDHSSQEAAKQAEVVARKIHTALRQPYQLESHGYYSSASIGITLFGDAQRESIGEPLKRAELAMYKAKAVGRNNLRFFEPEMRNAINARASIEADLHKALAQGQFLLYYHAQVGADARLTGVEALVRWQHPERGLILPGEFIHVAEANGLILPLGLWVLETACKQLAAWALRPEMAHLTLSVNVSARQFRLPNFGEEVLAILQASGANPKRLKLELTESVLLDNMKDIITKMTELKASGVCFSLDDFGTGYSSLTYLKRLPLDELKIDQGFVHDILIDPHDAAIAKMVIALAETMGLAVIAEGVETEAQRDFLAGLGCNNYQGYLFGRPLPIEEFEAFALSNFTLPAGRPSGA
jgi:diguanylate cyclase (GGDEF)-like protein/PAS domain S-box-containing protein